METTIQTALAQIVESMQLAPGRTEAAFEDAKTALTGLWQETPDNSPSRALVQTAWDQVHALAEGHAQMAQLARDAVQGAVEVSGQLNTALETLHHAEGRIDTLATEREAIQQEHSKLMEAIYDGDTSHPDLEDYAQGIREDAEEGAEEYAYDLAWESVAEEFIDRVVDATDVRWQDAAWFVSALRDQELNDAQKALLKQLVESCVPPAAPAESVS